MVFSYTSIMAQYKIKVNISPLRLSSASSVQIPAKLKTFKYLQPYVRLSPINLSSATSVNMTGLQSAHCTNSFKNKIVTYQVPYSKKIITFPLLILAAWGGCVF